MQNPTFQSKQPIRRRGSTYITVLGASMIVSLFALSAMLGHRVQNNRLQGEGDLERARLGAQAALKMAMLRIEKDPDWRYNFPNGIWEANRRLTSDSNATFTFEGRDPNDGDLTDDPEDRVVLTGIGRTGTVQQKMQVTLEPSNRGLDCMDSAMHAGGRIQFATANVYADAVVSSNSGISADASSIHADVEAAEVVNGSTFYARQNSGVEARQLPDLSRVFEYYLAHGTTINIDDIVAPEVPPTPQNPNLLINPGVEEGLSPWKAAAISTCIVTQSSSRVFQGSESLRVKDRVSHQAGPGQDVVGEIEDGTTYECEVYVYMKTRDAYARLVIEVNMDAGGTLSWATDDVFCSEDQWIRVAGTFMPSFTGSVSSATFRIESVAEEAGDEPGVFFIDEAVLRRQAEAAGDGILDNGDMEAGTANESSPSWVKQLGALDVHCSTAQAHAGSKSTYVGSRITRFSGAGQFVTDELQNGKQYEVRVWAKKRSSGTIQLRPALIYKDDDGTKFLYNSDFTLVTDEGWTEVVQRLTPEWEGTLKYGLLMWWTRNSRHSYFIDDAAMRTVAPPSPPPRTIYRQVLSPRSNPYGNGLTNPQGIYVIDCEHKDLYIERSRIVGTLVLLNPAPGSSVRPGPVSWQTAVPNFPALLVAGDFSIRMDDQGLSEGEQLVNFNPAGTPFAEITPSEDEDQNDTYLSKISGLIFATGRLSFTHHATISGLAISGGDIQATGHLDLRHNPFLSANPPPGFSGPEQIHVVPDSATKVVDSQEIVPPALPNAP